MKLKLVSLVSFTLLFVAWQNVSAGSFPVGTFDAVDNSLCQISGWVKDPDSTNPTTVHVYKDGPFDKGTFVVSINANLLRNDLPYNDKNHGFVYKFEQNSGLYDGLEHQLYLYGIDLTGDSNAPLNGNPKTIKCATLLTTVNVKDFGAKGDGINDDAPAIQKAITAVAAGGTVNIPAGTYMLGTSAGGVQYFPNGQPIQSAIIINKDNLVFTGSGNVSVLKLMANRKMRAVSITGKNVVIENITVDGNKSQRNGSAPWPDGDVVDGLVYFDTTASGGTIKNCEARNGIEDGIGFWKSDDAMVTNCYSHDNGTPQAGASGISLSGGARARAIGNTSVNNTIGMWSAFGSQNVTIQNNTIKNNAQEGIIIGGFTVMTGAGNNSGFTISGNTLEGNGKNGFGALSIASANNGTISGNTIVNNYFDGIQISDDGTNPSSGWTIQNNVCSNTSTQRIQKYGTRILGLSRNITLQGNRCENNGTGINDQIVVDSQAQVNSDWRTVNTISYTIASTPIPALTPTPISTPTPIRTPTPTPTITPIFCTMDAKLCPDGKTYVGRVPPSCEFAACPTPTPTPSPIFSPTPAPTPPVKLIRFSNDPKVYEVTKENQIKWVPSITAFNQLGLDWKSVTVEPPSKAPQYQRVKLMRAEGDTKVYYITEGGLKRHIPNPATFLSYGNKWSDVIAVKSFELSAISDNMLIREEGKPEVYKLENSIKRWIKTAEVFSRLSYKWDEIAPVNGTELSSYSLGTPIE